MFSSLIDAGGARVAFTDRHGGVSGDGFATLNLGRTDEDRLDRVLANLDRVRDAAGVGGVVALHQVHGREVVTVDDEFMASWGTTSWVGDTIAGQAPLPVADAAVTALDGVALMIRVADCVPVMLADARVGVVGAAHAGRVGLVSGVLTATVDAMRALGARSIQAWIGPHICGRCYEVPAAMRAEVAAERPEMASSTAWGTPSLDLGAGCERELARVGVAVHRHDPCTFTVEDLFSHRRQRGAAGRQAGLVWRP